MIAWLNFHTVTFTVYIFQNWAAKSHKYHKAVMLISESLII